MQLTCAVFGLEGALGEQFCRKMSVYILLAHHNQNDESIYNEKPPLLRSSGAGLEAIPRLAGFSRPRLPTPTQEISPGISVLRLDQPMI